MKILSIVIQIEIKVMKITTEIAKITEENQAEMKDTIKEKIAETVSTTELMIEEIQIKIIEETRSETKEESRVETKDLEMIQEKDTEMIREIEKEIIHKIQKIINLIENLLHPELKKETNRLIKIIKDIHLM